MSIRTIAYSLVLVSTLAGGAALAAPAREPASAEGVRQAEDRWSEAFMTGDAATLDRLLDADYVSVSATGKSRTKSEIIAAAQAYAAAHPGAHADPLPPTSTIRVTGNSAIVQHRGEKAMSVDVFYYQNGAWRAVYSQHTAVTSAALAGAG
jgi:hypothetical protein